MPEHKLRRSRTYVLAITATASILSAVAHAAADRPAQDPTPRVCPRIYKPVCGRRGEELRSFPNACRAAATGFEIAFSGPCSGPWKPRG
jgi:hypothetical protein